MTDKADEEEEKEVDLTLDNMGLPAGQLYMGAWAKSSLEHFGIAVLYVSEDRVIRLANPAGVFIQPGTDVGAPPGKAVWVRPIVGEASPRWIGWRDGQPWELSFEPEEQGDQENGNQ